MYTVIGDFPLIWCNTSKNESLSTDQPIKISVWDSEDETKNRFVWTIYYDKREKVETKTKNPDVNTFMSGYTGYLFDHFNKTGVLFTNIFTRGFPRDPSMVKKF